MGKKYVIGLDYGTDSVRAVLIEASTGKEITADIFEYPRWSQGKYCDPARNIFRQHPLDQLEGLESTIKNILNKIRGLEEEIAAISVTTTGSTPIAVDKTGCALALKEKFSENPNAMFVMWKDHASVKEADDINRLAKEWGGEDFSIYSGGIYSSEWFWSKLLHIVREDALVRNEIGSWVENCDWIPAVLTGNTSPEKMKRSRCAAGHKAMWHGSWGGLPSEAFLVKLDPLLTGFRSRLYQESLTADQLAGHLSPEWARKLGLPAGIPIGVGALDAHVGAVGAEIRPYSFTKVMGTSTCDILTVPGEDMGAKLVRGICGQVDGSVIPGMIGMEAGQSAFGDIYAWFRDLLSWPLAHIQGQVENGRENQQFIKEISDRIIPELSKAAERIPVEASGIVALDWLNGRRTPDANQHLTGVITGLSLGSNAPKIFKALVEATAFGAKKIIDRFRDEGIRIDEVIALGGVTKKSPLVMQTIADVLNMEIKVVRSEQTVALGAAMFAATVAGLFDSVEAAQKAMGQGFEKTYRPIPRHVNHYQDLFKAYSTLGDLIEFHF